MGCAECETLRGQVESLEWRLSKVIEEHDLAEQQITRDRRRIAYLEGKLKARDADAPSKDVQDVFDYWLTACRKDVKRTKLTSARIQAIRKAFREGYSVYDLQRATVGLAFDPFVKEGVTYNDITVACRNVELYRDKADAVDARHQAQKQRVSNEARDTLIKNCGRHYSKPELPALWSGGFEYFGALLRQKGCKILDGYGNRFRAQCPAHDGSNPQTLSVIEADDGRVLAKCFAGCTWEDICAALGVESRIFGPADHHRYGRPTDDGKQISFEKAA